MTKPPFSETYGDIRARRFDPILDPEIPDDVVRQEYGPSWAERLAETRIVQAAIRLWQNIFGT